MPHDNELKNAFCKVVHLFPWLRKQWRQAEWLMTQVTMSVSVRQKLSMGCLGPLPVSSQVEVTVLLPAALPSHAHGPLLSPETCWQNRCPYSCVFGVSVFLLAICQAPFRSKNPPTVPCHMAHIDSSQHGFCLSLWVGQYLLLCLVTFLKSVFKRFYF